MAYFAMQLEREVESWKEAHKIALNSNETHCRELNELRKDKARLDWLNSNNVFLTVRTDNTEAAELAIIGEGGLCEHVIDSVTVRQAIDAAMKGQP